MFRIFLIDLIQQGKIIDTELNIKPPGKNLLKNRRIYDRFDLNHKQISLLNEQDILIVRDISQKGFSTEVGDRSYERLAIGDIYRCKIRYLRENYSSDLQVRWKAPGHIGFELKQPSPQVTAFMARLLNSLEIGRSLQLVGGQEAQRRDNEGMVWYHGTERSNLFLWFDEAGKIKSWIFESGNDVIHWDFDAGYTTGTLMNDKESNFFLHQPTKPVYEYDRAPRAELVQLAIDVLMATQIAEKNDILTAILD